VASDAVSSRAIAVIPWRSFFFLELAGETSLSPLRRRSEFPTPRGECWVGPNDAADAAAADPAFARNVEWFCEIAITKSSHTRHLQVPACAGTPLALPFHIATAIELWRNVE